MNSVRIKIAGFQLQLSSDINFILEEGYLPFICEESNTPPDIKINCHKGIQSNPFTGKKALFEAEYEGQKMYTIYQAETGLGFIIYDQQNKDKIQQTATLDKSLTRWEIYADASKDGNFIPLLFPMGPIIMQYMTVNTDAVMIHASCAFDGKKGRIFTGFSGAGKSTISKIWADAGNQIINDDRLIIRKSKEGYEVHNTPMYYKDGPKKAPLSGIFLISHSPINKMKKVNGALAVSKVLAFCIQNNFDRFFINNNLQFLSELNSHVPIYELGFIPDNKVIEHVLSNEV